MFTNYLFKYSKQKHAIWLRTLGAFINEKFQRDKYPQNIIYNFGKIHLLFIFSLGNKFSQFLTNELEQ